MLHPMPYLVLDQLWQIRTCQENSIRSGNQCYFTPTFEFWEEISYKKKS